MLQVFFVFVVVVSNIQLISCQPKNATVVILYMVAISACMSYEQESEKNRESLTACKHASFFSLQEEYQTDDMEGETKGEHN